MLLPARLTWAAGLAAALPPTNTAPMGFAPTKPGRLAAGSGRGLARVEITCAGVAKTRRVEQCRRKDVGLLNAQDLLPEAFQVRAEKVGAGRRHVGAVINGVDNAEGIFLGKDMVEPRCSKVVPDRL